MCEVEKAISEHVESHHLGLDKDEIEQAFKEHYSLLENGRKLDLLVDDYFGPPVMNVDGEVTRSGGTKDVQEQRWVATSKILDRTDKRMNVLEHRMENGGVPAKFRPTSGQKWFIGAVVTPVMVASLGIIREFIG